MAVRENATFHARFGVGMSVFPNSEPEFRMSEFGFHTSELPFRSCEIPLCGCDIPFHGCDIPLCRRKIPFYSRDIPLRSRNLPLRRRTFPGRGCEIHLRHAGTGFPHCGIGTQRCAIQTWSWGNEFRTCRKSRGTCGRRHGGREFSRGDCGIANRAPFAVEPHGKETVRRCVLTLCDVRGCGEFVRMIR